MSEEIAEKLLDIAEDRRKLEIELLWQRSLLFSGITLAAFAAYASFRTSTAEPQIAVLVVCFGFISSLIWTFVNRGSKYWQEYWEAQIRKILDAHKQYDFFERMKEDGKQEYYTPKNDRGTLGNLFCWNGMRFSPSKLMIALSDFITLAWVAIWVGTYWQAIAQYWFLPMVATLLYGLIVVSRAFTH